jgi:hypothetical protein
VTAARHCQLQTGTWTLAHALMPTLDWIGKKAVLNHHNEVPDRPSC